MKKMQTYVCAILFPYFAISGIVYFAFCEESFMFTMHGLISLVTAIILCVWCNKSAVNGKINMKSLIMNIITKICYMPVYSGISSGFFGKINLLLIFNPLLIKLDPTTFFLSAFFLWFTGLCNIGSCIRLYRNGNCKRFTAIILCIMGFVYGLDITGGIIQLISSFKKETD